MKLRIAAVLLSTLASPGAVNAQCGFCPDGITADDPTADIPEYGQSCNALAELSSTLMDGTDGCKSLSPAEMTCCPSDDSEGDDFFGNLDSEGDDDDFFGNLFGGDNSTDDLFGGVFGGGTASDNPCTICPDGITVDGSTDLGEGATCDSTIADAVFFDEDSFVCSLTKEGAEMICCPSPAENPCPVCPDGITAPGINEDTPLGEDGETCADLVASALYFEEDGQFCSLMKESFETTCCPTPPLENPCTICPDSGITVDQDTIAGEESDGPFTITCGDLVAAVSFIDTEKDSETCAGYQSVANMYCCPGQLANPCPVCTEGVADEGFEIPDSDGMTCGDVIAFAANIEASDMNCVGMKAAEAFCCPTPAENPCPFCTDGLTVDGSTIIPDSDGFTCASAVKLASSSEESSAVCPEIKSAEAFCCPTPAENPCPFCSDGLTVDGSTIIPDADGATCALVAGYALNVEESSEKCSEMKEMEVLCCGTPAENPCPFCSGGLTVDGSTIVPDSDETSCAFLVKYAPNIDESSEMCSEMKEAEVVCCGTPAENPCPFCTDGLTVDGSTIIPEGDGATCAFVVDIALNVEESSETCSELKDAEPVCCGTPAENPCPFCSDGLTVDGNTIIPGADGATCALAMSFASTLEESSEMCSEMSGGEAVCCPPEPTCFLCGAESTMMKPDLIVDPEGTYTCKDLEMYVGLVGTGLSGAPEEDCPTLLSSLGEDINIQSYCGCEGADEPSDTCKVCKENQKPIDDPTAMVPFTNFTCEIGHWYAKNVKSDQEEFCAESVDTVINNEACCVDIDTSSTSSTMPTEVAVAPGATSSTGPTEASGSTTTVGPTVTAESVQATVSPTPTVPSTGVHVSATTGFILAFAALCVQAMAMM